jgi:outer membrane immunogenic protein
MTASRLAASIAALALGAAAVAAGPASAQSTEPDNTATHYWYGMIGYSNHEAFSSNLGTLDGRLGARWGWFGLEGETSWGVNHSRIGNHFTGNTDVPGITAGLNNQQTIYGVGYVPLGRGIDLFARAGWGRTDWNFKGMAHPDDDETNWNIGGGGQWFWDTNNGVRAEYTRENFNIVPNADDFSISYVRKF